MFGVCSAARSNSRFASGVRLGRAPRFEHQFSAPSARIRLARMIRCAMVSSPARKSERDLFRAEAVEHPQCEGYLCVLREGSVASDRDQPPQVVISWVLLVGSLLCG